MKIGGHMELFPWKPEYSVQNDIIDSQHKGLVNTINHFKQEETLMRQYKYPDLPAHQSQHQAFTDQVATLMKDVAAGRQTVSITLLKFLKDWLQNHILKVDKLYSSHIRPGG